MQTHAKQLLRIVPSFLPTTLQTRVRFTPVASHTVSVVNRLFKSQENYVGGYGHLVQESWTNWPRPQKNIVCESPCKTICPSTGLIKVSMISSSESPCKTICPSTGLIKVSMISSKLWMAPGYNDPSRVTGFNDQSRVTGTFGSNIFSLFFNSRISPP